MVKSCQWCCYSLAGLPPRGWCPECGRVYDASWEFEQTAVNERVRGWLGWVASYWPSWRTVSIVVFVITITAVVAGLAWHGYRQIAPGPGVSSLGSG